MKRTTCLITLTTLAILLSGCGRGGRELSEKEAKSKAAELLKAIFAVDCEENDMSLVYKRSTYDTAANTGSMTREAHNYWIVTCPMKGGNDYQLGFEAETGELCTLVRYPMNWFDDSKEAVEYQVEQTGEYTEDEICAMAREYCEKAGFGTDRAEIPLNALQDNILLLNPQGDGRTKWMIDYYEVHVYYQDGRAGTVMLIKDDLSLLGAKFLPNQ